MNTTLRRTIPFVASAALVGSALLAGSGAALAAKPVPQIGGADKGFCWKSGAQAGYRTTVDLSANKGRWAFVTVTLDQDGADPQQFFVDPPLKLEKEIGQNVAVKATGSTVPATLTVTLTNRKGVPYTGPGSSVTTPLFCFTG